MKAISRQSKTLMGIALLALGVYLWLNFLVQSNSSLLPPFFAGNQSSAPVISSMPPSNSSGITENSSAQAKLVVAPLSSNGNKIEVINPNVDLSATTAAREVIIVDLPFLITEAPVEELDNANAGVSSTAQNQHLRATVNPFSPIIIEESLENRMSATTAQGKNPSLVQTVSGQPRPTRPAQIVGQSSPAFKAPTELIKSTPLRTVTPAPSLANNLPRTLSRGTLSSTPGILRNQNVVPPLASEVAAAKEAAAKAAAIAEQAKLEAEKAAAEAAAEAEAAAAAAAAEAAATVVETSSNQTAQQQATVETKLPVLKNSTLRTPQSSSPKLALVSNSKPQIAGTASLPGLLQSGRDAERIEISAVQNTVESQAVVAKAQDVENNQEPIDIATINPDNTAVTVAANAVDDPNISGGPIEAGVSELTRYLRDYNFQYTGSVIGAVRSVGMFRTNVSTTPITITLGQNIPKTDIVLTNLQNNQAEFTKGQDKVILNLDLRR